MSLQPIFIAGSSAGLQSDKKPFLIPDQAFPILENAYVWRDRVKKREGLELLGRLRRVFSVSSLGNSGASPWSFNIYSTLVPPVTPEANAEIEAGNVTIVIGAITFSDFVKSGSITAATNANPCQITSANHSLTTGDVITIVGVGGMTELNGNDFEITVVDSNNFTLDNTDSTSFGVYTVGGTWSTSSAQGNGILVSATAGNSGTINYLSGDVTLTHTAGAGVATTITFGYFPSLPVMGIWQRELSGINEEQTIFFDTKYAYIFSGTGFQEFITGTTWDASDSDFFWCTNYRGITQDVRLFFATDFLNTAANPMRYTDGVTWTTFAPGVSGATPTSADNTFMFQARILIPYYGRLLALNTYEGTAIGTSVNYFNRCRFSQIGNPIQATVVGPPFEGGAWRSDVFGKGGFIDAPTNEAIVSAAFIKNTLVVFFEKSTWQLRYVGEYGLPFIWERVSSDFGSESTFSSVVFDNGLLTVGDKGIISADAVGVRRIDEQIPDQVFEIQNINNGVKRVIGVRDFQRELVFWCFSDQDQDGIFPSQTLVYNYRNNTYAKFRNSVTFFGTFQSSTAITWDSLDVFWYDEEVTWDLDPDSQAQFPRIVSGNQQGFIHYYGYTTEDEPSLAIKDIDSVSVPPQLTIPNHNLQDFDIIYITDVIYSMSTDINDRFYEVHVIDTNTVSLFEWDSTNKEYGNAVISTSGTYLGNGKVTLFPTLYVQTKDFNPYQAQGGQFKLSYIDFLTDATPSSAMTVELFINSSPAVQANLLVGNTQSDTSLTTPYYVPGSDYAWHRFYATTTGQYLRIVMTYDGDLMNTLSTHQQDWILNAMALWMRPGGKVIF